MNKWTKGIWKILSLFGIATGNYICFSMVLECVGAISILASSIVFMIGFACLVLTFIIDFIKAWSH